MNILWLSWKDSKHPQAGGAELVSSEIRKRLVRNGHSVRLITSKPNGMADKANNEGVEIFRVGSRYSVYPRAFRLYRKEMQGWADIVIDEMNTIPFFGFRYDEAPAVLLTYQLARDVWFHQMIFPFSLFGYIVEPIYLKFMSKRYKLSVTESESTRQDLIKYGFLPEKVKTFRVGMNIKPLNKLPTISSLDTVVSLGSVRPMKQTMHAVKAFELAKDKMPKLKLEIIGDYSGKYGEKVYSYAKKSRHSEAILFHGKVDELRKKVILQKAGIIIITSIKEGWGLIATEAASQGVPAVAYATDGLKDSIIDGKTGLLVKPGDYSALADKLVSSLNDKDRLEKMRLAGLEYSRQFTFENSYDDFVNCTGIIKGT